MTKVIATIGLVVAIILVRSAINYKDEGTVGYLTRIRLVGAAVLITIGSIYSLIFYR